MQVPIDEFRKRVAQIERDFAVGLITPMMRRDLLIQARDSSGVKGDTRTQPVLHIQSKIANDDGFREALEANNARRRAARRAR